MSRDKFWRGIVAYFLFFNLASTSFADNQVAFEKNAWQFLFVPTFETDSSDTNRLSAEGLNHSLLFGQLLSASAAGLTQTIQGVYAWSTPAQNCKSNAKDISTLQSIEPFAVLNNLAVNYNQVSCGSSNQCDCNNKQTYNSPAFLINSFLANNPYGIYVIAMPKDAINSIVSGLPNIKDNKIRIESTHQYLLASITPTRTDLSKFEDGLKPKKTYPSPDISEAKTSKCPQKPTTLFVNAPNKSPFKINTNMAVSFIRHVEAHPNAGFENGNYVCAGQWRALGANAQIKSKINYLPDYIFTTNPNGIIACNGTCSYIRPTLTIAPFATEYNKTVEIADFPWNDAEILAAALFTQNSPFSKPHYANSKGLVAWEHVHIQKAIRYLIGTLYQNQDALKDLPEWQYTDYDSIWSIKIDAQGNLQFSNSCEGISTELLPSSCPSFYSEK